MRITRDYLRRWKQLEVNRNRLNRHETDMARKLFNALKELSVDELYLLKCKYHDTDKVARFDNLRGIYRTVRPNSDEEQAKLFNMDLKVYKRARLKAEANLNESIQSIDKIITEKSDYLYMKIGDLFVKGIQFDEYSMTGVSDVILTLSYGRESYLFDMTDKEHYKAVEQLERRGFERVKPSAYQLEELGL